MDVELITVGNELLLGQTINTNAAEIAIALTEVGAAITRSVTVPDRHDAIVRTVRDAISDADVVITTGGLGPTRDDVTKIAVAAALDVPLIRDHGYVEELKSRFGRMRPGPMPESNLSQADVPEGGERLANPLGSAPGLWINRGKTVVVLLPGVPREMRGLMANEVVPRLKQRAGKRVILSRTFKTTGISESALADDLKDVEDRLAPLSLALLPSVEGVELRITASDMEYDEAVARLDDATTWFLPLLGNAYYGTGDLAGVVLEALRGRGLTLSCAESCTGGLIGQRITAIPGSSDVFFGGVVAYSNAVKERVLGVPGALIERHGAVSSEVAMAMVEGAMRLLNTSGAVSVTGVAGPGGGTEEKPVGTVHLAAAVGDSVITESRFFPGDRDDIRRRSAQAALNLLRGLVLA